MGRQRRTSIIGVPPAGLVVPNATRLWTPADIPELTGWWDADSGITLDGANVSSWANKIGAGSFGRGSTAGPQLSSYNGTPTLLFDGNAWMQMPGVTGVTPNSNASVTLLCAAAPSRGSGGVITVASGSMGPFVNSSGFAAITFSDKIINVAQDSWTNGGHRSLSVEFSYVLNPILRTVQRKSAYMDRSPYVFGRDTSNDPTQLANDQNGRIFAGSITGVAMSPLLLGGIDIDRWEGYYAHKTKSTNYLPATHPFKLAPPRI